MQNSQRLLTLISLLSMSALSGCVYKIDVQQGNIVSQEMIDQLRPGMTRSQSRFVMGTPLMQDTFHPNRWDYLYTIEPGGGERLQERQALLFQQDTLVGLDGDFTPGMGRDAAIRDAQAPQSMPAEPVVPTGQSSPVVLPKPPTEEPISTTPPAVNSLEEELQREVESVPVAPAPEPSTIEEPAQ